MIDRLAPSPTVNGPWVEGKRASEITGAVQISSLHSSRLLSAASALSTYVTVVTVKRSLVGIRAHVALLHELNCHVPQWGGSRRLLARVSRWASLSVRTDSSDCWHILVFRGPEPALAPAAGCPHPWNVVQKR
jgi:hypothetical protein